MKYHEFKQYRRTGEISFGVETVKSVQYLEDLAARAKISLDDWDLDLFKNPKHSVLFSINFDVMKLNEIFFTRMEELLATPEIQVPIAEEMLQKLQAEQFDQSRDTYLSNAIYSRKEADNSFYRASESLSKAHTWQLKAEAVEGRKRDLSLRLNEVLKDGAWRFHAVQGPVVQFVLVSDLILIHRNEAAKQHYRVNFGKLRADLNVVTAQLLVHPHEGGVVYENGSESYWHPHINHQAKVCFGDMQPRANRALVAGDYAAVFNTLYAALSTYNDGNPYIGMSTFQKLQPESRPGYNKPYCQDCCNELDDCKCCDLCDLAPNECECFTCPACDARFSLGQDRCGCCTTCEQPDGECECANCSICDHWYRIGEGSDCNCCQECETSECEAPQCRECGCTHCGSRLCNECDYHRDNCHCEQQEELSDGPRTETPETVGATTAGAETANIRITPGSIWSFSTVPVQGPVAAPVTDESIPF